MAELADRMRAIVAAAALVVALCIFGQPAAAQDDEPRYTINMRDADIHAFIEDVSSLTGFTFIPHPEVQGNVTVTSQTRLTREEVFDVFLATMRNQGYAVIPSANGAYRIVPESAAAQNSGVVGLESQSDDEFITEVIQLDYVDAGEAAMMVTPMVNHRGQVSSSAGSNVIIVVDYAGNIERIREVLRELDQDRSTVDTIALQSASAYDVARVVNDLFANSADNSRARFSAVALESANSVLVRGNDVSVARARQLISRLDVASEPTETLRVMRLQHAEAEEIVPVLEAVARTMRTAGSEQEIQIPFDPATNSLVLAADPQTLNAMVRVVQELDVRRAQVRVEAIIVEISDDLARDLGVQFLVAGENGSSVPFAATNFSNSAPNLLAITGALTVQPGNEDDEDLRESLQDFAISSLLGSEGALFGVGGENNDNLFGLILNAVEADAASNVLSTPSITTLDNEPARFLVGQEIPITTGEALGANNDNPFRTIERRDVGVQLEVLPQINQGDTVQLYLRQEVSSVAGVAGPAFGELITNKREIETTALADNGEIIVIGGLIETREIDQSSQVPVLGSIPVVGRAFSSNSRSRTRKNLMIFIRTTIIRDSRDARTATAQSYSTLTGGAADFDARLRDTLGDVTVDR
ncbi:MAG: type II secretion system secretin GspD [Maricaulaceae bacterium]